MVDCMQFIIDGYNVVRTVKRYIQSRFAKIKDEKQLLLELIKKYPLIASKKHETIIVFDGYDDSKNLIRDFKIKVIFSQDESADEVIKNIIENSKKPEQIYIISDDREIKDFAKIIGANTISVKELLNSIYKSDLNFNSSQNNNKDNKEINSKDANKINKELWEIWKE